MLSVKFRWGKFPAALGLSNIPFVRAKFMTVGIIYQYLLISLIVRGITQIY